ncbi:hypothetical protein J4Q44_G00388420 [Coregonus suidteri]|uniref:EGF-like domain-containing protein n=1 Tax=Coregonus suidteri TaxID=861788 RepID=A0AAN8KJP2_9TELE
MSVDGVLHQMTWPPQSPDLNPIEMFWDESDGRVKKSSQQVLSIMWETPSRLLEKHCRLPFPQAATWYLTLQVFCNSSDCGNITVTPQLHVSACIEDCGTYGECRLLRSYSYLYAACVCKAGWSGWGCTDDITAQSYGRQLTAVLLLTLSNLLFIPPIIIAVRRCYITEASVYLFTMFFSTFYYCM